MALCLLLSISACTATETAPETVEQERVAETLQEIEDTAEEDPIVLAEREIIGRLDYSNGNFISERDFYNMLTEMLSVHGVEMSASDDANSYFCFDYVNVDSVRFLTMSKTQAQIDEDIALINEALADTEDDLEPNEVEFSKSTFDKSKDVLKSDDRVTSFVVSATSSQDDQTLMYIVASAALTILNPNYSDTKTAFNDLKSHLFKLYSYSDSDTVSWVDGIDNERSFTIPGNAIECWLGVAEDDSIYIAITTYIQYDEIIDIAGSGGTSIGKVSDR